MDGLQARWRHPSTTRDLATLPPFTPSNPRHHRLTRTKSWQTAPFTLVPDTVTVTTTSTSRDGSAVEVVEVIHRHRYDDGRLSAGQTGGVVIGALLLLGLLIGMCVVAWRVKKDAKGGTYAKKEAEGGKGDVEAADDSTDGDASTRHGTGRRVMFGKAASFEPAITWGRLCGHAKSWGWPSRWSCHWQWPYPWPSSWFRGRLLVRWKATNGSEECHASTTATYDQTPSLDTNGQPSTFGQSSFTKEVKLGSMLPSSDPTTTSHATYSYDYSYDKDASNLHSTSFTTSSSSSHKPPPNPPGGPAQGHTSAPPRQLHTILQKLAESLTRTCRKLGRISSAQLDKARRGISAGFTAALSKLRERSDGRGDGMSNASSAACYVNVGTTGVDSTTVTTSSPLSTSAADSTGAGYTLSSASAACPPTLIIEDEQRSALQPPSGGRDAETSLTPLSLTTTTPTTSISTPQPNQRPLPPLLAEASTDSTSDEHDTSVPSQSQPRCSEYGSMQVFDSTTDNLERRGEVRVLPPRQTRLQGPRALPRMRERLPLSSLSSSSSSPKPAIKGLRRVQEQSDRDLDSEMNSKSATPSDTSRQVGQYPGSAASLPYMAGANGNSLLNNENAMASTSPASQVQGTSQSGPSFLPHAVTSSDILRAKNGQEGDSSCSGVDSLGRAWARAGQHANARFAPVRGADVVQRNGTRRDDDEESSDGASLRIPPQRRRAVGSLRGTRRLRRLERERRPPTNWRGRV